MGILDTVGVSTYRAGSLRKVRSGHSGACLRISRSSDDTEQDIGFDGGGLVDTAAALSFVGAGNGRIVKLYDQSGNSRDWVQATLSEALYLIVSGSLVTKNSMPAMTNNADQTRHLDSSDIVEAPYTLMGVWSFAGRESYGTAIYDGGPTYGGGNVCFGVGMGTGDQTQQTLSQYGFIDLPGGITAVSNSNVPYAGGMKYASSHMMSWILNGAIDGTTDNSANATVFLGGPESCLFGQTGGMRVQDGTCQEFLEFDTAVSDGNIVTISADQYAYWITGVTPPTPTAKENSGLHHIECGSPMGKRTNGILHPIRHGFV